MIAWLKRRVAKLFGLIDPEKVIFLASLRLPDGKRAPIWHSTLQVAIWHQAIAGSIFSTGYPVGGEKRDIYAGEIEIVLRVQE